MKTLVNKSKEIIAISLLLFIVLITNKINAEVPAGGNNNLLGYVYYQNEIPTAVASSVVSIYNTQGLQVATTTSNQEGYYSFTALPDGTYTLIVQPSIPWGGANATDAHLILQHFVQTSILEGLKVQAADAFKGGSVNAKDALAVARRFVGLDNFFSQGDFVTENMTVTLNGNVNMIHNIQILATGDVNASYDFNSAGKKEPTVFYATEGTLNARQNQVFELPLKIQEPVDIRAISLILNYEENKFKIEDVIPASKNGYFSWHAENGVVRITWFDTDAYALNPENILFTFKVKALSANHTSSVFEAEPETEFAGLSGSLINGASVSNPEVQVKPGFGESEILTIYPNPVKSDCKISIISEKDQPASIKVINLLGEVKYEKKFDLQKGVNAFQLELDGFAKGIYLVDIQSGENKIASKKITRN